jgi:hypothetical protein
MRESACARCRVGLRRGRTLLSTEGEHTDLSRQPRSLRAHVGRRPSGTKPLSCLRRARSTANNRVLHPRTCQTSAEEGGEQRQSSLRSTRAARTSLGPAGAATDVLLKVEVGLSSVQRVDGRRRVDHDGLRVATCAGRWSASRSVATRPLPEGRRSRCSRRRTDGLGPGLALEVIVAGVFGRLCALDG